LLKSKAVRAEARPNRCASVWMLNVS
jgi:hypothetical protein